VKDFATTNCRDAAPESPCRALSHATTKITGKKEEARPATSLFFGRHNFFMGAYRLFTPSLPTFIKAHIDKRLFEQASKKAAKLSEFVNVTPATNAQCFATYHKINQHWDTPFIGSLMGS
jgi:hypothetical protein